MKILDAPVFHLTAETDLAKTFAKKLKDSKVFNARFKAYTTELNNNDFEVPDVTDLCIFDTNDKLANFGLSDNVKLPDIYQGSLSVNDDHGYYRVRKNSKLSKFLNSLPSTLPLIEATKKRADSNIDFRFAVGLLVDELSGKTEYDGIQNIDGQLYLHVAEPQNVRDVLKSFELVDYQIYKDLVFSKK